MTSMQDTTGSQSVDRALKLLSLVGRSTENGMSLNEIVEAGGFNKATTRRLLLALMRARLIEQDEGGRRYYLGQEAYVLGTFAANRFGLLEMSMESLIRISRQTGDTSFLSIRRHTHSICLHREEGTFPIRSHVLQKGFEHPLGIGAASLAMLATLDDEEIEAIMAYNAAEIARDFPTVPPSYIPDGIAAARIRGYAVNPGMIYPNSWAIGIALRYPDGRLAGAISVTAIDSRMQEPRQQELVTILRDEAAYIEAKLAHMIEPERKASRSRTRRENTRFTQTRRLPL
ncbi:transcriptional regulator [Ensifer adhaerens]|uniref:Transcriptional regulator n=1 Tax=Ensifer adhaerens TaxID=106592 RepID=A0A0L8BIG1_ENSAD|nr:IclR family transcriptional regulator [Ensifer adhaerens]KOF14373.1 transcriptional regulator [Ensifer adhaerens]